MKKSSLRAFGIACFLIGALLTTIDQFNGNIPFMSTSNDDKTIEQYKKTITKLEKELNATKKQVTALEENQSTKTTKVNDSKLKTSKGENNSQDVVSGTLYIYSGITPYEVGKKLEDLGIVKNGVEMELYLAKPEYAQSIQIGQFELNSSMSIEEIAKIITGKKK